MKDVVSGAGVNVSVCSDYIQLLDSTRIANLILFFVDLFAR